MKDTAELLRDLLDSNEKKHNYFGTLVEIVRDSIFELIQMEDKQYICSINQCILQEEISVSGEAEFSKHNAKKSASLLFIAEIERIFEPHQEKIKQIIEKNQREQEKIESQNLSYKERLQSASFNTKENDYIKDWTNIASILVSNLNPNQKVEEIIYSAIFQMNQRKDLTIRIYREFFTIKDYFYDGRNKTQKKHNRKIAKEVILMSLPVLINEVTKQEDSHFNSADLFKIGSIIEDLLDDSPDKGELMLLLFSIGFETYFTIFSDENLQIACEDLGILENLDEESSNKLYLEAIYEYYKKQEDNKS